MDALLLASIIFSAQLLVIIGVATIAEALASVTDPRLRLTCSGRVEPRGGA